MSDSPTGAPDPVAQHALEMARSGQNLPLAAAVGLATTAVSAAAWAGITATTGYQIGFMAIGVGLLVGLAVRATGRGVDASFRVLAASLAFLGCAVGNLLTGCVFFAQAHEVGLGRVFEVLDLALAWHLMRALFSPIDLLFYAIAIWEAWRLSVITPPAPPAAADGGP